MVCESIIREFESRHTPLLFDLYTIYFNQLKLLINYFIMLLNRPNKFRLIRRLGELPYFSKKIPSKKKNQDNTGILLSFLI